MSAENPAGIFNSIGIAGFWKELFRAARLNVEWASVRWGEGARRTARMGERVMGRGGASCCTAARWTSDTFAPLSAGSGRQTAVRAARGIAASLLRVTESDCRTVRLSDRQTVRLSDCQTFGPSDHGHTSLLAPAFPPKAKANQAGESRWICRVQDRGARRSPIMLCVSPRSALAVSRFEPPPGSISPTLRLGVSV